MNKKELQNRLIDFAIRIIRFCNGIPASREGNYVAGQMVRSGNSPAFNYGEACEAESKKDMIHKMKIILKELRETNIALTICMKADLHKDVNENQLLIKESDELISIFVASVRTLRKNMGPQTDDQS
jgi:four helix bundle protein